MEQPHVQTPCKALVTSGPLCLFQQLGTHSVSSVDIPAVAPEPSKKIPYNEPQPPLKYVQLLFSVFIKCFANAASSPSFQPNCHFGYNFSKHSRASFPNLSTGYTVSPLPISLPVLMGWTRLLCSPLYLQNLPPCLVPGRPSNAGWVVTD